MVKKCKIPICRVCAGAGEFGPDPYDLDSEAFDCPACGGTGHQTKPHPLLTSRDFAITERAVREDLDDLLVSAPTIGPATEIALVECPACGAPNMPPQVGSYGLAGPRCYRCGSTIPRYNPRAG